MGALMQMSPTCQRRFIKILIWWYFVFYAVESKEFPHMLHPRVNLQVIIRAGVILGEFRSLSACTKELDFFYIRNPNSFVRCEGSKKRITVFREDELQILKLKAEIKNRSERKRP